MRTTIDRVGRVVIPKALREAVGISGAAEVEIMVDGSGLRIEPTSRRSRSIIEIDGFPALTDVPGAVLTDTDVRGLRDADQR
jgi:AbrB family looped-hinge helix DNA binding protein